MRRANRHVDKTNCKDGRRVYGHGIQSVKRPNYTCRTPAAKEAVLKAARELNYVPNEAARNLKLNMTSDRPVFHIRILATRVEASGRDPFFDEMIPFLTSELHRHGNSHSDVWYEPSLSDESRCRQTELSACIERIRREKGDADGLIILGKCCKKALCEIRKYYKNIVAVTRNTTDYQVDEVLCDGRKMAVLAMEHLILLGHKRIAYLGDCHNESRYQGYQETLFRYQLGFDINFVLQANPDGVEEALDELMGREELPTAIYCACDKLALKAIEYFNAQRPPCYFPSIVSNDDTQAAQYTRPMLTTVQLPKEEMAQFAIYLLLDRLKGGHRNAVRIEMKGKLVVRESCSDIGTSLGACEYYI